MLLQFVGVDGMLKTRSKEVDGMTQHEKNLEYTLATQAIEKLRPSQKAIDLCEQVGTGEISADTAVSILLKHYALDQVRANG